MLVAAPLGLLRSLLHMLPRVVETIMIVLLPLLNLMHMPIFLALACIFSMFEMPFVMTVVVFHGLAPISIRGASELSYKLGFGFHAPGEL